MDSDYDEVAANWERDSEDEGDRAAAAWREWWEHYHRPPYGVRND